MICCCWLTAGARRESTFCKTQRANLITSKLGDMSAAELGDLKSNVAEVGTSVGVYFQPACSQHKYIRHADSSHIFERPERLRAVMVGVAAAVARCETSAPKAGPVVAIKGGQSGMDTPPVSTAQDDLSSLLDSLSIQTPVRTSKKQPFEQTTVLNVVPPPSLPAVPGNILLHSAVVNLTHTSPPEAPFLPLPSFSSSSPDISQSPYLKNLVKWANEAPERIRGQWGLRIR